MRTISFIFIFAVLMLSAAAGAAQPRVFNDCIIFIPIDSRPITDMYTADTMRQAGYKIVVPPEELLGGAVNNGDPDKLWSWLDEAIKENSSCRAMVISTDALIYGSLVASRKHEIPEEVVLERAEGLRQIKARYPYMRIYAFSSIMRTPQMYDTGGKEPDYYKQCGVELYQYSAIMDRAEMNGGLTDEDIAQVKYLWSVIGEANISDWFGRREKNFAVNQKLIDLAREGVFDYLVIGRDDNAPLSQTHREGRKLKEYAADLDDTRFLNTSGIDEIAMLLMARADSDFRGDLPFISVAYNNGAGKNTIPGFSDEPIGDTVEAYIRCVGGLQVKKPDHADLFVLVNTLADGINPFSGSESNRFTVREDARCFADMTERAVREGYPVTVADLAFYNGADNAMMAELEKRRLLSELMSYGGWNTATNSLGTAIGQGLTARFTPYNGRQQLLLTRYLDEWAYEANIRQILSGMLSTFGPDASGANLGSGLDNAGIACTNLTRDFMKEHMGSFAYDGDIKITLPWNRLFENRVELIQ